MSGFFKKSCHPVRIRENRFLSRNRKFFVVKVAGGATAQCLALLSALYLHLQNKREFKVQYFPTSTGTYWPFQIDFLLNETEILESNAVIRGLSTESSELKFGKVIANHPLSRRGINYEKTLVLIRKLKLEAPLHRLKGQFAIEGSTKKLKKVSKFAKSISGSYPPLIDCQVFSEMDARFKRAGMRSPFSKNVSTGLEEYVVVHIRIGDKRSSFTNPADFGGDGIIDPQAIAQVLSMQEKDSKLKIFVISDEPEVARDLLMSVNVFAEINSKSESIWDDLYFVSQAKLFIGSWSQVSQLGAVCVLNNGGKAYYPSTTHNQKSIPWFVEGLSFYEPKFLPRNHPIYD
jgi:hypothetical protein